MLVCAGAVLGLADAPKLEIPTVGTPIERVAALWDETRTIVVADAGVPMSDTDLVSRGAPMIEVWTALDTKYADTDAGGATGAVLKLLHDFYGRAESSPSRRNQIRQRVRSNFGQRLSLVDSRVRR